MKSSLPFEMEWNAYSSEEHSCMGNDIPDFVSSHATCTYRIVATVFILRNSKRVEFYRKMLCDGHTRFSEAASRFSECPGTPVLILSV